jgi:hypothetical protein
MPNDTDADLFDAPIAPAQQAEIIAVVADAAVFRTSPRLLFHFCATQRERLPVIIVPSILLKSLPFGLPQPIRPMSGAA